MYFASEIETVERVDIKVLIVGAGPAGIGTASALKQAGVEDMLVVDIMSLLGCVEEKSWMPLCETEHQILVLH